MLFNQSKISISGLPHPRVNLRHGIKPGKFKYIGETCTACAGTMILEFAGKNPSFNLQTVIRWSILKLIQFLKLPTGHCIALS